MHRRTYIGCCVIAVAAAIFALGSPGFAHDDGQWVSLFDGHSLEGWTKAGDETAVYDANWTAKDGLLQADKGTVGYLVSKNTFGDVQIRAEFWVSDDANSGVFIRATDPLHVTSANAYEINIFDTRPEPEYGTGAIVNVAKVGPMPKTGGRWNVLEITANGDRFSVTLNGTRTVDNVQDGSHARGHIALQYRAGVVKFRSIEVRT